MIARTAIVFLLVLTLTGPIPVETRQAPAALRSQNELIERRVLPHLEYLFQKLIDEKRDTTLDGTKAFSGGDRFLPGKIALGLSLVLINTSRTDRRFAAYLGGYRDVADMTVEDVITHIREAAHVNLETSGLVGLIREPPTVAG